MTIAYFSNQFATAKGHGIARYAHHLYKALCQLSDAPNIIPVAAWSNREKQDLHALKQSTKLEILPWGRRITPLTWKYLDFPKIEQGLTQKVDLVHAVSLGYSIATSRPYIVTIHDIGPLTHASFFTKRDNWLMKKSLEQALQKAKQLVCVSQATADAVQLYAHENYQMDVSNRITVALEGVSEQFFQVIPEALIPDLERVRYYLDQPFILAVGKISPRKNLRSILKALSMVKDKIPHQLLTVGGDGWDYQKVKEEVDALGLKERVHFLGYVSDELLRYLYRRSSVFVYPSLFEGFGLTILEAMASNCPVITSNLSSLPEVAGNAGVLIDPKDAEQLSEAIYKVCSDKALADKMKEKGIIHAKTFTWEKCAIKVNKLYQKLA